MTMMMKLLAGGAGIAAFAATAPAGAQYAPYGHAYGYGYNPTQMAAQQCAAAVQSRLNTRGSTGILGAIFGVNTATNGRVLSVTRVNPNRNSIRVRGLASSGTRYGYGPYGVGAYGSTAYAYQPDLSFSCTVDYRGRIRDVDIDRRRR